MKILVGCEYSGIIRDAFISAGHDAVSCDLIQSESPGPHIIGDVLEVVQKDHWDLIIIHPPCTALSLSGNGTYAKGKPGYTKRLEAIKWTTHLWEVCKSHADRVCLENPLGVLHTQGHLPKPQYVQPYQFGHKEKKKTGLYLHNLPQLVETNNVEEDMLKLSKQEINKNYLLSPQPDRAKIRSKTYTGIAQAMVNQWSNNYEE